MGPKTRADGVGKRVRCEQAERRDMRVVCIWWGDGLQRMPSAGWNTLRQCEFESARRAVAVMLLLLLLRLLLLLLLRRRRRLARPRQTRCR